MSDIVFSSWGGQVVDNRSGQSVTSAVADIKLPLKYADNEVAAFVSWDGLVITDKNVNVVALASAYMREAAKLDRKSTRLNSSH